MLSLEITSACKIKHTNTQTHTKRFPGEQPGRLKCPSVISYQLIRTSSSVPTENRETPKGCCEHVWASGPECVHTAPLPAWQLRVSALKPCRNSEAKHLGKLQADFIWQSAVKVTESAGVGCHYQEKEQPLARLRFLQTAQEMGSAWHAPWRSQ